MNRLGFTLGLLLIIFYPICAQAANLGGGDLFQTGGQNAGIPVFSFLKLPTSARSIGLAASVLTTDEEASIIQSNPAGLGLIQDYYYSLSHAEVLGEFRHENLAFTYPTEIYGNFGGTANILAATAFQEARDIDENPVHPTAYDMALGMAYANSILAGRCTAGGRLDLIRSSLDGTVAYGYGLNAGIMFMLISDLRLALVVKNLSHGATYDTKTAPLEPLPLNVGIELGKPLLDSKWSGQVGLLQSNESLLHYYFGGEWKLRRYIILRMGYEGSSQDRQLGSWTGWGAGLGIRYERLTLDYGYKPMGPLGAYHAFTLNYSRKSKFRTRDEVLLEAAQEQYRRGEYKRALKFAQAAVDANPYNFKAQALSQKLQLELDRINQTAVAIIYTANTDGNLAPEWKNGHAIGGLARRKTKLLELKGAQGKCLILDAGNLTAPKRLAGGEKYVYGAYAQMPYDAINLGSAEFIMGPAQWDTRLPFLSSQNPVKDIFPALLTEKKLRLKGGVEITVLGAMESFELKNPALGEKELETVTSAIRRRSTDADGHRILILLYNGTLLTAHKLAEKVPELDAIILSGEAQALGSPMKVGNTLICSPGRGGTVIGNLTFILSKTGTIKSFRHFLMPLDASIPNDPQLEHFLEPVTVDPNKLSLSGFEDEYRAQVIAYIRTPDTTTIGQLILRDLTTGRDYPIPSAGLSCSKPVLGFGKNKLAFVGEGITGAREIYGFEPSLVRLDTLTHMGGKTLDLGWILGNNALLAVYEQDGKSDLYRIDPWSHEIRNLSKGKLGLVKGFGITKVGDRIALNTSDGKASTLWVTNLELESPLAILIDKSFLGSPKWNPQGSCIAFLTATEGAAMDSLGNASSGELRVFDIAAKKLISATQQSRVRNFSWSADGKRVLYSAGINLADINSFNLDSMSLGKMTKAAASPRSEENPTPKMLGNRDGFLFETVADGNRKLMWMDMNNREEKMIVDSTGSNALK